MTTLLVLLTWHFVGDFLLQSDWMALGKSRRILPLLAHGIVYSLCFAWAGLAFVLVTFVTHTATDAVTSRINQQLWDKQGRHWFFVGVGADQLIHAWTLAFTARWLMAVTG